MGVARRHGLELRAEFAQLRPHGYAHFLTCVVVSVDGQHGLYSLALQRLRVVGGGCPVLDRCEHTIVEHGQVVGHGESRRQTIKQGIGIKTANHRNPQAEGVNLRFGCKALDVVVLNEPTGFVQHVAVDEVKSLHLLLARLVGVDHTVLVGRLVIGKSAADVADDMAAIALKLVQVLTVHCAETGAVDVAATIGPFRQMLQLALQVAYAIFTGLHGIVAEVLGLATRVVGTVGFAIAKPQARLALGFALHKFFEFPMVARGIIGLRHRRIAPLNGPKVVVANAGEDALTRNAILGLGHVVEAGVVHDAGRVAMRLDKGTRAKAVDRHQTGRAEVVTQAQRVADLMRRHEADEFAHQFGREVHGACSLVDAAGLHHVPVVHQTHDIVIPANVAFKNLAAARVVDMRPVGILNVRGEVANDRIPGVFHRHGAVVFRPLLGHDGILETSLLKRLLPVVHALNEVRAPLLRRGGVNVIHNGLARLHQFAPLHAGCIGTVLWLQAPTGDEAFGLYLLLGIAEFIISIGKITHARVEEAAHHGLLGQQNEGDVHAQRDAVGETPGIGATRRGRPGAHYTDFSIRGKGGHALNVGQGRDVSLQAQRATMVAGYT